MIREGQIKRAEIKYSDATLFDGCDYVGQVAKQEAFIAGAKWADEHPKEGLISIEKAKIWVRNAFAEYFGNELANNITDEFIKTMEE